MTEYWYIPKFESDRVTEEIIESNNQITKKWTALVYNPEIHHGNLNVIQNELFFDTQLQRFSFYQRRPSTNTVISLSSCLSSALALYTIGCLFECDVHLLGDEGYKSIWRVILEHTSTGAYIGFGDYKGSFQVFLPYPDAESIPLELQKDLLELLQLFISGHAHHPYDGVVAGTVG